MRPHYPDIYEGCVNGCDSTLCEILQINISRSLHSPNLSQSIIRNVTTNQSRSEIIIINILGIYVDCYLYNIICILDPIYANSTYHTTNNNSRPANTPSLNNGN